MTIRAPKIVLADGRMTSLTNGSPLDGSGIVDVEGSDFTIVSADSTIRGSTKTEVSGLQNNLGADLQLPPSSFLDTGSLLQPSCADRGAARSTFTRTGRGGLVPAPDRPLPAAGAADGSAESSAAFESVFLNLCAGTLVSGRES